MSTEYAPWGPLVGLIGEWSSGFEGVDTSFHSDKGKIGETRYREATSFTPFGPVTVGSQTLYGLDYRTSAWLEGADTPFHTEVGYWMWDAANQQVVRCFVVPHSTTLMAGGTVEPDATTFKLASELGSNTYGILSNQYLDAVATTTRYDVTITIGDGVFSYDQTTVVEYQRHASVIMHTDRNTLHRLA